MGISTKMGFLLFFLVFTFFSFALADNSEIITREEALGLLSKSETIIENMREKGFSVSYFEDRLIEARRTFEQAEYALILRGEVNSTEDEKNEARIALRLVKWQEITYNNILFYTEDIHQREQMAFYLLDKISVDETKIRSAKVSNETLDIFVQAKTSFLEERYNETVILLEDFNLALEQEKASAYTFVGIKMGAKNFFQRYWAYIIIFLTIFLILFYFLSKIFEKKFLLKRIMKMKVEKKVLNDLIKKTQVERYKENSISGLVYNIRMKKYEERLQEIKEELPVFEERLKRFKNR